MRSPVLASYSFSAARKTESWAWRRSIRLASAIDGNRRVLFRSVAGQQAALPVGDALAGIGLVLFFGGAQDGELGVAAINQVGIGHQPAKVLVAPLEGGVFEQNFGQRFGMRVE